MSTSKFALPLLGISLCLVLLASPAAGVMVVNHGTVSEFTSPDQLHLDPATAVIAVDVFGNFDRSVNGVLFQADGPAGGVGIVTNGGVTSTVSSTNQIDNWAAPPAFTGGTPGSAANLAAIMQDIRWSAAPNPVTVDISGLTPGRTYELQMLFNEGRNTNDRRWDIGIEGQLVVDDFSSEGVGVWNPSNSIAYTGEFTMAAGDTVLNVVMQQHIGGQNPMGPDNNPILQAVIVHDAIVIPEPSTLMLAGLGLCALAGYALRRRRWRGG